MPSLVTAMPGVIVRDHRPERPRVRVDAVGGADLRTLKQTRFKASNRRVLALDVAWVPNSNRLAYIHRAFGPGPDHSRDRFRTILPNGKHIKTLFGFRKDRSASVFAWQTLA